jgi:hypothetical protein
MQSVGAENTFSGDLTEIEGILSELQPLIDKEFLFFDRAILLARVRSFILNGAKVARHSE